MRWMSFATWTLASSGLWLAVLWLAGCSRLPAFSEEGKWLSQPHGQGLVAKRDSPLPDVPVPIGFVALEARSVGYVTQDGVRMVRHIYQGRAGLADAVEFYRQELRHHGWRRLHEDNVGHIAAMRYVKGPESLIVRLSRRHTVVTLRLNIEPLESSHTARFGGRTARYTEGR